MMQYPLLMPDGVYHIYNRANGWESLFSEPDNYRFFLVQFDHFMGEFVHVLSFCLMPNHFHFLIQIKDLETLRAILADPNAKELPDSDLNKLIVKQFSRLFNSYSKAYNKQQSRKGSLFMPSFKRKPVTDPVYLRKLVHYIHSNPVEAGLVEYPEDWDHSSYRQIVFPSRQSIIKLETDLIFDVYGDLRNLIDAHTLGV